MAILDIRVVKTIRSHHHTSFVVIPDNLVTSDPLHLGRTPKDACTDVDLVCQQCDPFPSETFVAKEDTAFVAVIGPAANPRGYTAITGIDCY